MLLFGAQTPSHHARRVYEQASTFDEAVKLFSTGDLIDEVYYIVGGAAPGGISSQATLHRLPPHRRERFTPK